MRRRRSAPTRPEGRSNVVAVLLSAAALLAVSVGLAAPPAVAASTLTGTIVANVPFPTRTLLLSVPGNALVTAGTVHVSENGGRVAGKSATSLRQASQGDLGVVMVIDSDPSMSGAPLTQALAAARTLAAERTGNQEVGVIYGDGSTLPLTTDSVAINRTLSLPPRIVPGTNLLEATQIAVNELTAAKVTDGAVIFVSDDIDRNPAYTPQSVAAFAAAAHVRVFTVGIRDRAFSHPTQYDLPPSAMANLARAAGGTFSTAVPSRLRQIFTTIEASLTSQYVVRYRSLQPLGRPVAVRVTVTGVPGAYTTRYVAPPATVVVPARRPVVDHSFWTSSAVLVLVAIGGALLIGIAVMLLIRHFNNGDSVTARVNASLPEAAPALSGLPGDRPARASSSMFAHTTWWTRFEAEVDVAHMPQSPRELANLGGLLSLVVAVLLVLVTGSVPLAVLGLLVGPFAVRALVRSRVRHQQAQFSELLPAHLEEVAGAIRSGRSVIDALGLVSEAADEPLRDEFSRALADERLGRPLEETLSSVATRMQSDGVEQLAIVTALQRRTGSSVAEVLDRIAESAREHMELQRELRALTAQGRLARWILTLLPPLMLVAFSLIDGRYERPMFHTVGGIVALIIGTLMVTAGSLVMKRIVDIEV
jgi:Flp pilus assembly protein TadB